MINLRIRLNPGSVRSGCWHDDQYGIVCSVREQPIDGKANKALIKLISELICIPKSSIRIVGGVSTRYKTLLIATNTSKEVIEKQLCGGG